MAWKFGKDDEGKVDDKKPEFNVDDLVSKLRTSFQEDLKATQTTLTNEFNGRLQAIEESTRKPAAKVEQTEIPSVYEDENAAFAQRLGPLAVQIALTNAKMTENNIFSELRDKGWGEYIDDVRKVIDDTPIQEKAKPAYEQYLRGAVQMIVGRAAMGSGLRREKNRFVLEDVGSGNSNSPELAAMRTLEEEARDVRPEGVDLLAKSGGSLEKWASKLGLKVSDLAKDAS
jgi:hypothetical protein